MFHEHIAPEHWYVGAMCSCLYVGATHISEDVWNTIDLAWRPKGPRAGGLHTQIETESDITGPYSNMHDG